jgi:predicted outer membrane repeat protein
MKGIAVVTYSTKTIFRTVLQLLLPVLFLSCTQEHQDSLEKERTATNQSEDFEADRPFDPPVFADPVQNKNAVDFYECDPDETHSSCTYFVNKASPYPGNGTTWCHAFRTVQQGIDAVEAAFRAKDPTPRKCQVWVAKGTYYIFNERRMDTVRLVPMVELYGGFNGTESTIEQRDIKANETVLSGADGPDITNQVYHVVTGADGAVLDGFTITEGNAVGARHGGGMYNDKVSPEIRNCSFHNNTAGWFGGGMFNSRGDPKIINSRFTNNSARRGGGMFNQDFAGEIENSIFIKNSATLHGGGMTNQSHSDPKISNSIFLGNSAKQHGGAIYNVYRTYPQIINCTIFSNSAEEGGGGIYSTFSSASQVVNSIFWTNEGGDMDNTGSSDNVTYSLLEGSESSQGNIAGDPRLFEMQGDYLGLMPDSPCIDAANGEAAPATDMFNREREDIPEIADVHGCPDDNVECVSFADMGAIEFRNVNKSNGEDHDNHATN